MTDSMGEYTLAISIHKALAGLDPWALFFDRRLYISIHKALAGLDVVMALAMGVRLYFNPQGPRGPRP